MRRAVLLLTLLVCFAGLGATARAGRVSWTFGPVPGPALGRFTFTYYWIADEHDYPGDRRVHLYDDQCVALATVALKYLRGIALEGTGRLTDGRLINFGSRCLCSWSDVPCFREIPPEDEARGFGIGVEERALHPFRSVAVDDKVIPIGAHLYVPDLEGLWMPGAAPWGGFVHDGCLTADDRGSAIGNEHLDFFVVSKPFYQDVDKRLQQRTVRVYAGGSKCP